MSLDDYIKREKPDPERKTLHGLIYRRNLKKKKKEGRRKKMLVRQRKTSVKWASLDIQCATRGLWLMHSGHFLLCAHRMAILGRLRCAKFISNHFSINQKAKSFSDKK